MTGTIGRLRTLIYLHFFLGEHPRDATEALAAFISRCHLPLHHNGKDSLSTETHPLQKTPMMWFKTSINHLHHPQVFPGTKKQTIAV